MDNNIIESYKKYMLIWGDSLTPEAKLNLQKFQIQSVALGSKGSHHQSVAGGSTGSSNKSVARGATGSSNKSVAGGSKGSPLEDTLFWCFFIILNGDQEYELDHSFKREKEFKIESIEKLRAIKNELKAFKLRLNEIENELLNEKKITIKSLIALCLLYKINIMYIWNKKYFEIINNADEKNNIIINDNKENKISDDISNKKINYYRDNYWCIENVAKPLKAIASYSKDELITIIEKLEIKDISAKKTKKEMYEKILQHL